MRSYTWLRTNQIIASPIDRSARYENTSMQNVAGHRPPSPSLSVSFTTHLCFSSPPTLLSALVAVVAGAAFCRLSLRTMSSMRALSKNAVKKRRRARVLLNRSLDAEREALRADEPPVVQFRCRFISHVVRASLSDAGPGCVVVLGVAREGMLDDMLTTAELTSFHDPASHYIFNSTPLGVLKRLLCRRDQRADTARRFGPLQEGSAGEEEIRSTANRMAKVLTTAWRTGYVAREPTVLVSAPGAARQLAALCRQPPRRRPRRPARPGRLLWVGPGGHVGCTVSSSTQQGLCAHWACRGSLACICSARGVRSFSRGSRPPGGGELARCVSPPYSCVSPSYWDSDTLAIWARLSCYCAHCAINSFVACIV